ncbi:MAG: HAMP domain-containing histidine kinase [Melioribacteraceae bacterium]|nr:HAMP domain-containing histidine kinase [Melioribacteraceae bacterium]
MSKLTAIIFFCIGLIIHAQLLSPPYKFTNSKQSKSGEINLEGFFSSDSVPSLLEFRHAPEKPTDLVEFRITGRNNKVEFVKNYRGTKKFSKAFHPLDIDDDGLDELFYSEFNGDSLFICYLDYIDNRFIDEQILMMPKGFKNFDGSIVFYKHNVDEDDANELIILIMAIYPTSSSYRGVIALDLFEDKILWEHKTADMLSSRSIVFLEDKIYYASSAVENYFFFSNGNFFDFESQDDIDFSLVDTTAGDFSSDSESFIRVLDAASGEVLKSKKIGGALDWAEIVNFDNCDSLILIQKYRKSGTFPGKTISKVCPSDLSIKPFLKLQNSMSLQSFNSNSIFFFDDNQFITLSGCGNKIKEIKYEGHISNINNQDTTHFLIIDQDNKPYLTDIDFNTLALIDFDYDAIHYFPIHNLFKIKLGASYQQLQLTKVPLTERFTNAALIAAIGGLAILIIVLITLWGLTMRISREKIEKQKNQIEKAHYELKEATPRLIQTEKLAALGTIASGVAHELNSPLGAIINSAERLLNMKQDDDYINSNLTLIEKASNKCKHIVQRFLYASKPGTGIKKVNMKDAVDAWLELFGTQFVLMNIEFIVDVSPGCYININENDLSQIFTNLLFNSRDSIMQKENDKKQIKIIAKINDDFVEMIFIDTGEGFAKEILKNPFKPFQSTKEEGKGTGLGLWITENLVKEYDGTIEIQNLIDGAQINIKLPLAKD